MRIDPDIDRHRPASDGCTFVYVLPLQIEDLLKLGFSRDPLARMRALHRRFFDFFDCQRIILVETERVREARTLETVLKRLLREHRASAPIEIPAAAGGDSEWYRGAYAPLCREIDALEDRGYRVRRAPGEWLRAQLQARCADLFEWSALVLEQMRCARSDEELRSGAALAANLRDALDALSAFDIDVAQTVPSQVEDWYRAGTDAIAC